MMIVNELIISCKKVVTLNSNVTLLYFKSPNLGLQVSLAFLKNPSDGISLYFAYLWQAYARTKPVYKMGIYSSCPLRDLGLNV